MDASDHMPAALCHVFVDTAAEAWHWKQVIWSAT